MGKDEQPPRRRRRATDGVVPPLIPCEPHLPGARRATERIESPPPEPPPEKPTSGG